METIHDYLNAVPQQGVVDWIGLAPARREPLQIVQQAEVQPGTGFVNEHHANGGNSQRQVTLIQAEHIPVIAALSDCENVTPELLRRNVVVSGVNLLVFKDKRFHVGNCLLEGTGPCAPCGLMEQHLGAGGYNAMRGHGGITAIVIEGGTINVGDKVVYAAEQTARDEVATSA